MASKVQIGNFALSGELGKDQMTSLDDDTKAAKLVNLLFDDTAQEVMTLGAFSSATFRQTLGQDATAPDFGFSYRYTLPTDPKFLGMLKITELRAGDYPHSIESGFLLTDEAAVKIQYKGFQTDTEKWDYMLQRVFVLRLAAKLCYTLTGNLDLKKTLIAEFNEALDTGLGVDGMNSGSVDDTIVTPHLLDVRL
jgi:hypothetical protein